MNWTKASAVAEILSSVAVVATLIYLGVQTRQLGVQNEQLIAQTRQNTAALQTSARQETVNNDLALLLAAVEDPGLWLIQHKEELTDAESMQLAAYLYAFLRVQEHNWLQFQAGTLDEETWRSYQVGFVGTLSKLQTRRWWEHEGRAAASGFAPGLTQYVDSLLVSAPMATLEDELRTFR